MRKFLVRTVLALPERWLIAWSGGAALTIEGRTLDPRVQFLAARAKALPPLSSLPVADARLAAAEGLALLDAPAIPTLEIGNIQIPAPGRGAIPARLYRPRLPNRLTPVLVYFHMGGCVIGDLETCHFFCSLLSQRTGSMVVSVDYRLAPEHKFPAALDDALTAYRWVRENARGLGGNPARIGVGGDSAGGMLAAVIAQEMRRAAERAPVIQLLIYPGVDWASETPSMTSYAQSYPLSAEMMLWFKGHYLENPEQALDPRVSPLRAADFKGLPPALIYTAGHDPLVDQGRDYAEALKTAGVPVLYRCFDSLPHGFTAMSGAIPVARRALDDIAQDLRRAFG